MQHWKQMLSKGKFLIKGNVPRMKQVTSQQLKALEQEVSVRGGWKAPSKQNSSPSRLHSMDTFSCFENIGGLQLLTELKLQTFDYFLTSLPRQGKVLKFLTDAVHIDTKTESNYFIQQKFFTLDAEQS